MLHQKIKDVYYSLFYPASLILLPLYKAHYRTFRKAIKKLQIGCGKNYLPGFINIDGNYQRNVDYLLDARAGLPFPDNSIKFIYSCHMLEHVYVTEAIDILKECYRVLESDGYIRLTLPDFNYAVEIANNEYKFNETRIFASQKGQAINFLFCDGQHKYAYTSDVIEELALSMGYSKVESVGNKDLNIKAGPLDEPVGSFSVNIYKTIN